MRKLQIPFLSRALALMAVLVTASHFPQAASAQTEPYEFKEYKRHQASPVKSQDQTGTCWAFSTVSFLESEALRLGKKDVDLSEMYVVRYIYRLKCENYVRRQGHAQFGEGGLAHDALHAVAQFGVMPESAYPGRKDPKAPLNHGKLEKTLKSLCDDFVKLGKDGKLPTDWLTSIDQALDVEFGQVPAKFTYNDVVFTPTSYREYLGLKTDDYVTVTSFTHHPFWSKFILEIPDNWANGEMYNMPVSDLMRCAKNSIEQGYVYCSEAYMRQNTLSFTVHKDGIPEDIRRRLGLSPGDVNIEKPQGKEKSGRMPANEVQLGPNAGAVKVSPAQRTATPAQKTPTKKTSDN